MKAFSIIAPGEMQQVDLPTPVVGSGEVLLRVERIGLCGSDLNTYRGLNPLVTYPRVPGHEIQGRVESIATDNPVDFAIGASVTILPYTNCGQCPSCDDGRINACRFNQTLGVQRDGALCEYIHVPATSVIANTGLSDSALALVEPLSVGSHAVDRGRVADQETVMIVGAGMIGLGAIAAAHDRGARVIAVDIDDAKLEIARLAGAAETINSRREHLDSRIAELTAGDGPDVAIEAVGHPQTFLACVEHVRFAGRVVYIGYAKDPVAFATKWFILKELDILGSRNATRADFARVVSMLRKGVYPIKQTLTEAVPFARAGEAMKNWDQNPAAITKIHVHLS